MSDIHLLSGRIEINSAPRVQQYDPTQHTYQLQDMNEFNPNKQLFLISFHSPVTEDKKQVVQNIIGHPLTEYLPDNAFFSFTTPARASHASSLEHVAFVGPYQPEYKIAPAVSALGQLNEEVMLNLLLANDPHRTDAIAAEIAQQIAESLNAALPADKHITANPVTNDKITLSVPPMSISEVSEPAAPVNNDNNNALARSIADIASIASQHPHVSWIERHNPPRLLHNARIRRPVVKTFNDGANEAALFM